MPEQEAGPVHYADRFVTLARSYALEVDLMRCRKCKRGQQVTWREHAFPHAAGCKNERATPHPWLLLCVAVEASPLQRKPAEEAV